MKNDPVSSWDFPAVLLLYLILLFSTLRLISTNWTSELYAILVLTFFGTTIGLALGASRFRLLSTSLLALGYSLTLIPWVIANNFYKQVAWLDRMNGMSGRLGISLSLLFQKKPIEDTLLFITFLAVVYWSISMLAGYQWTRYRNITLVLLATWVVMVTVQVYDNYLNNRIYYLIICMFLSLLLVGRKFILGKQRYWHDNHVLTAVESGQDLTIMLVTFTSAIILLAWAIPVNNHQLSNIKTAWVKISEPWQSVRKDLGNAIAGLENNSKGSSNDLFGSDLLPLGQEAITGETAVFNVTLPPDLLSNRFYWRIRIYDQYNDDQWSNIKHNNLVFEPYMPGLRLPDSGMSVTSEFIFTIKQGRIFNLPVPPQTVWISRPVNTAVFQLENGMVDPILLQADLAIHAGESYQVQAIQSNPSIYDLQQAGKNYPDWVVEHYLQRPANLSNRVKALAIQLTADKHNPYDRAVAITNYLRREITYNKEISNPPFGANVLEWFLLDYKQGYCNYYATAEVILLREAGIPARMVVGFAQGEKMPGQDDTYIVRQKNAHAWPEAYFPGIGWVEFEPTTSQPELLRPIGITPTLTGSNTPVPTSSGTIGSESTFQPFISTPLPGDGILQQFGARTAAPVWLYIFFGLILIVLGVFMIWRKRVRRLSIPTPLSIRLKNTLESNSINVPPWLIRIADRAAEAPIQRYFNVIYQSLKRLGQPALPADTPQDVCNTLMESLPAVSKEITLLQNEYHKFMFSQHTTDVGVAHRASLLIRKQTNRAVFNKFINQFKKGFKPSH
jgi:transglutaminase-like putative cysteine protease